MRALDRTRTETSARAIGQRSIAAHLDKVNTMKQAGSVHPMKNFAMAGLKRATSASRKK